jgi:phosphopantothenate synthetase
MKPRAKKKSALGTAPAEKATILTAIEDEFRTYKIARIGEDFFEIDENGGERGAWQNSPTKVKAISRSEARAKLLATGMEVEEVEELTR